MKYGNAGWLYYFIAWLIRHRMRWLGRLLANNHYYKEKK